MLFISKTRPLQPLLREGAAGLLCVQRRGRMHAKACTRHEGSYKQALGVGLHESIYKKQSLTPC